jgi:hypothetical protein
MTAAPRGNRRFCSIRTGGASMKLKIPASATGMRTSRAKYKMAMTITKMIRALTIDEDDFIGDPPMNATT